VPTGSGIEGGAGEGELLAWRKEVERLTVHGADVGRERDVLRERQMMLQDRTEKMGKTVAVLRRDVERYLRQISDDAAARELLALERDQLRRKAVEAGCARFGGLHILYNNAGVVMIKPGLETTEEVLPRASPSADARPTQEWDHTFDLNVKAYWRMSRLAVLQFERNKGGAHGCCIVNNARPTRWTVSYLRSTHGKCRRHWPQDYLLQWCSGQDLRKRPRPGG